MRINTIGQLKQIIKDVDDDEVVEREKEKMEAQKEKYVRWNSCSEKVITKNKIYKVEKEVTDKWGNVYYCLINDRGYEDKGYEAKNFEIVDMIKEIAIELANREKYVRCIDNNDHAKVITIGKIYLLEDTNTNFYIITNDKGDKYKAYFRRRFKNVDIKKEIEKERKTMENKLNLRKGAEYNNKMPELANEEIIDIWEEKRKIIANENNNVPTKYDRHQEIVNNMNQIYRDKNEAYGDAFAKTFKKYGIKSSIIRIADKFHRLEAIISGAENRVSDEKIEDTIKDMANYCIMTLIEIENREVE